MAECKPVTARGVFFRAESVSERGGRPPARSRSRLVQARGPSGSEIRETLLNFRPRLLGYCASPQRRPKPKGVPAMSMYIGEALVGDGNEIAHIDLMIGSKTGPVG